MAKKFAFKRSKTKKPKAPPSGPTHEIVMVEAILDAQDQIHMIAVCSDGTVWVKLLNDTTWKRDAAHETFDEGTHQEAIDT